MTNRNPDEHFYTGRPQPKGPVKQPELAPKPAKKPAKKRTTKKG